MIRKIHDAQGRGAPFSQTLRNTRQAAFFPPPPTPLWSCIPPAPTHPWWLCPTPPRPPPTSVPISTAITAGPCTFAILFVGMHQNYCYTLQDVVVALYREDLGTKTLLLLLLLVLLPLLPLLGAAAAGGAGEGGLAVGQGCGEFVLVWARVCVGVVQFGQAEAEAVTREPLA